MPNLLIDHSYGKSRIRLTKITRLADRHEVRELTVEIQLTGDFAGSYTTGDNRTIIPTDTMKNVAYALAREHPLESIEEFAGALGSHFLAGHPHVETATVRLAEQPLERIGVGGVAHPYAFAGRTSEQRTSVVHCSRGGLRVESGIDELFLLKTTDSAFHGFLRDRYTTLADSSDRIMATMLKAQWVYANTEVNWNAAFRTIRSALIETFAQHQSLSVQHTLHAMGAAALDSAPSIERITLTMPNKHRILIDLAPFGLPNANDVFVATDEPYGVITGTLERT